MPYKENGQELTWTPNSAPQIEFLSLPDDIKEALFGGGAGSGKSEILLMYAVVKGWHNKPGFKQLFTRRTSPEITREILPRSKTLFLPLGAKYNKTDNCWTFPREDQYGSGLQPDGGLIFFGHCENEDDVHKYDGMEINLWTPDELTSYLEFMYLYIGFTRVRSGNPKLPAIIRASGMPGDIGHTFVKKRFIDPYPKGGKVLVGKGGNKRFFVHATYRDNPDGDPTYGQSLEALPEAEKRAKKFGDWESYEGAVFDEFRDKHYPLEPENALHVIDPFEIPRHWPRLVAIDWGFAAMCSVGWAAISPDCRVFIYRHQFFYREKIEEWSPRVKFYIKEDEPNGIVICHSANQHRGDPHTILEQVTEALDYPVRLGERDRVGGKLLVHEYLRWKAAEVVPEAVKNYDDRLAKWLLRNKGEEEYKKYIATFQEEENDKNLPKLLFFNQPDVRLVWEALKACNYIKSNKEGKKKEDVAEFDGDDPYDMLRMLLYAADQYFADAGLRQSVLSKKNEILVRFEQTQDVSQFYRNMKKLETDETNLVKPIRRFHRARR